MAIYATVAKAVELYDAELIAICCSYDGDGAPELESFEKHLRIGDRTIHGYLLGKYALPLENPPENLEQICVDIAIYSATKHKPGVRTKGMEDAFKEAIEYLTLVATNRIKLEIAPDTTTHNAAATPVTQTHSTVAVLTGDDRVMRRDTLRELV